MSLDFEKYVAKGVIGDLSVVALYTSGANWKIKCGLPSPGHLESKTVQNASIMRMSTLCGYLVQRRDLVQGCKKQSVKSWYNRPRGPPTQPWAANRPRADRPRAAAATRPPVTCSPLAKTGPPVAVQTLFVLVAEPNVWTNSKVKIFSIWEEYSPFERIILDLLF